MSDRDAQRDIRAGRDGQAGREAAARRTRVLVVEDSAVIRRLLAHIVENDPRLELVGMCESAEAALAAIPQLRPDVISMDIRLPGMDGLEATRRIMADFPTPIVVIADAVEDASLRISMNALRCGALSVVEKPGGLFDGGAYPAAARAIATQLAIMSKVPVIRRRGAGSGFGQAVVMADAMPPGHKGQLQSIAGASIMGVAASTGGPQALSKLLGQLPATFPLPIMLVQHIGAPFVDGFAHWLDGLVPLRVATAQDGEVLRPGRVYVAPGGRHLTLAPVGDWVKLEERAPVSGQKPSATVLFESLARLGPAGLGVLLTGMGDDGAVGLTTMRRAGCATITEHESTAVVYGMPGVAARLGGSCASLPIEEIAPTVLSLLGSRARNVPA